MTTIYRNVIRRTVTGAVAGTLLFGGAAMLPAGGVLAVPAAALADNGQAAKAGAQSPEQMGSELIRVALFADLGSRSPGQTPQVTLSSTVGLRIGARGAGTTGAVTAEGTIRFSADDYKIKLYESKNKAAALAVLKQAQANNTAFMIQFSRRGATFYSVYAGSYPTEKAAGQALDRMKGDQATMKLVQDYKPQLAGPNYLQAGIYSSEKEAAPALKTLLDADIDAYLVTMLDNGKSRVAVWAGQAASAFELGATKQKIARTSLTAVTAQAEGALIHMKEADEGKTIAHYRVNGDAKWMVSTRTPSTILVTERYGRAYRGDMEISLHKDKLALVNEVPLEQYLVSVVGGEVYAAWPQEALKAQAVASRTFALYQNDKFELANVVDTTLSQAYSGVEKEQDDIRKAVEATAGEVLMQDKKLIEAIFHSNAGGKTADPSEIWGGDYGYFQVVDSPDEGVLEGKKSWFQVILPDGKSGYVREDVVRPVNRNNEAGFEQVTAIEDGTNVRPIPAIQSNVDPVAKVNQGTAMTVMDTVPESNEMHWFRGPYTSSQITAWLKERTNTKLTGPVTSLKITERGPSGRVTQIEANGIPVGVSSPNNFRSAFGDLPSTLFDIVPAGTAASVGADGKGKADVQSQEPSFLFVGHGNGHGIGMSQWGAKGLADQGYDYEAILKYYYKNVDLVKR
ncbi:SpoIID/LytB domain-containing protein [Paenibacillus popilliae]|uniref:Sporulation protein n=1 Tax=Paenibacillus popilliae ATCC 14706 TaxID=1212764 RepID=M9LF98_PAEPP|nr:SpoIID/LytB domain-containing protein [Paenibacillus popilliae]GAC40930.1 sporulation protein [Paenibacillus popilliae ATCC 14706]